MNRSGPICSLEAMYDSAVAAKAVASSAKPVEKIVYVKRMPRASSAPKVGGTCATPDEVSARLCGKGSRFAIDRNWVLSKIVAGKCMATGVPFNLDVIDGRANPLYPSIDRIDSRRGYEPDNVQIVVLAFNSMKSSLPMEVAESVILAMADGIRKKRGAD